MRPVNFAQLEANITELYKNYYQKVQDLPQIEDI